MAACSGGDSRKPAPTDARGTQVTTNTEIAFDICVDNKTWSRPAMEEHRARLEQDPRYPVNEELLAWYDAHFIRDIGSASEDRKYGWAGIWEEERTAFELEGTCAQPPNVVNPVAAREVVELWLLSYETLAVRHGAAAVTVEVRRHDPGYQVIHFDNPMREEGMSWGVVTFVDEQGRELARIGPDEMQGQLGRASEAEDLP